MFRKLRRTKNAIGDEEALKLLMNEKRGILAVNGDDGYPFAIPVDYCYEDNKIYFHGAKSGHKVDALKKDDKVCFTVYGDETFKEGDWAPYLKSIVVFGRCKLIEDEIETKKRIWNLAKRFYPTEEEIIKEMNSALPRVQLYEITIEHFCGKQIHEK